MKYIVGNWKANKNNAEATEWTKQFNSAILSNKGIQEKLNSNKLTVIICPSFPQIEVVNKLLIKLPNIVLGAQDVSMKEGGSFTGEVSAASLKEVIRFVIVGHSERRANFNETNETVENKASQAKGQTIEPIVCIRGKDDTIPTAASFVAYEPVGAIGSGNNEPLEKVLAVKKELALGEKKFLYGGSVNPQNVTQYLQSSEIDGLLVGGASLDPASFISLLDAV